MIRLRLLIILLTCSLCAVAAGASQPDKGDISEDFLTSKLALKADSGTTDLGIRVGEFLAGIKTPKKLDRKGPHQWVLQTEYEDPVINALRTYVLVFQKIHGFVILETVTFEGRVYSRAEMKTFAEQIIQNYSRHIIVK